MTRMRAALLALLLLGVVAAFAATARSDDGREGARRVAIRDDCDRNDPQWNLVGGCTISGSVTFAEFNGENASPLSASVVGHQAWRNDPSYVKMEAGTTLRVRNAGGRPHTFTRVANFGGGKVPNPALNKGLVQAPECPASVDIAPGGSMRISNLAVGNHRFQCCIHPWMRALVKVTPSDDDDSDDDD